MAGPSSKRTPGKREPTHVPHPDDEAAVRAAFEAADGVVLSAEESAAYLHWLEKGEAAEHLKAYFETGERPCPAPRG